VPISDWPAGERPREKLLTRGAQSLSDAELLAIFLRTGIPGKSAVDVARDMINVFGSLKAILTASCNDFCEIPGLGPGKYVLLQAVTELAQRCLQEKMLREDVFANSGVTRRFVQSKLSRRGREVFLCLFLDNQNRLIAHEELFLGTIDGASVHPREVVKQALYHNAAALIFAHNHPSGVAEPSQADISITKRLVDVMKLVDVRIIDHMIVSVDDTYSFAEHGLI
jgi:DNA repair protein RadC